MRMFVSQESLDRCKPRSSVGLVEHKNLNRLLAKLSIGACIDAHEYVLEVIAHTVLHLMPCVEALQHDFLMYEF